MAVIFVLVIGTLFASDLKAAEVRCLRNLGSVKQQRAAEFNQTPHQFPDFIGRFKFDSALKAGYSETEILNYLNAQENFSYNLDLSRKSGVSDFDIVNLFIFEKNTKTKFANFTPKDISKCVEALILGEIIIGDYDKFLNLLRKNTPYVSALSIASPGGNVDESMKIGDLVRGSLLRVSIPSWYNGKELAQQITLTRNNLVPKILDYESSNSFSGASREYDRESTKNRTKYNYSTESLITFFAEHGIKNGWLKIEDLSYVLEKNNRGEYLDSQRSSFLERIREKSQIPSICSGEQCVCASSCALIWTAGALRTGNVMGLHRPYFSGREFGSLGFDVADQKYKNMILRMSAYLDKMQFPAPWRSRMMDTASSDIHWVSESDEFQTYAQPPSVVEWLISACGQGVGPALRSLRLKYGAASRYEPKKWSLADRAEYNRLADMLYTEGGCEVAQFDKHRSNLNLP